MANLKQIKCPSCGAGLSLNSPYDIVMECPYCHSQVINENAYQSESNSVQPDVLPFRWTEDEIMEKFVNQIADIQDSSIDLFVKMKVLSINKYYVPMYMFEGSFRAPWTAKVPRRQKRVGVSDGQLKETSDTVYDYVNGEAVGNFSFKSVPEEEAKKIGIQLDILQDIETRPIDCLPLLSVKMEEKDNITFLPPTGNADYVWHQSAEDMALSEAYAIAQSQCPKPNGYFLFDKSEIVSCSASCEMRKATLVFIPICRIDYEYEGNSYHYISYAEQDDKWTCDYPIAETIQAEATEEQQALLDSYESEMSPYNNYYGCSIISLIVLEILTIFGITDFFKLLREANFGWYFPLIAIVVFFIYGNIVRKKEAEYGIDEVNADIANRTNKARKEALEYKKQTAANFIETKAWKN